jgi:hypothetical protein
MEERSGGVVGRKSRRAADVANFFGQIAPDLSRAVEMVSPMVCRWSIGVLVREPPVRMNSGRLVALSGLDCL